MYSSKRRGLALIVLALITGFSVVTTSWSHVSEVRGATLRSSAAKVDLAYVSKRIKKALAIPKFKAPGPAFNAKRARGKSIFIIPETSSVPFVSLMDTSIQKVAIRAGLKATVWPTQGQPSQWVQGIDQAIAQKANLIVLGAPPDQLQPQINQANKAGIPVVNLHLYDKVMPRPSGIAAYVYAPFTAAGRLEADWVIKATKGKADALIVTSNEVTPSPYIVKAIQKEFAKHCSTCKTTVVNVPAADWGTKMQSTVQSSLLTDPNINYVIPLYDSASQFVAPAITAAHKQGSVHIASYNNTPFVLQMLRSGSIVRMDCGESPDWIAYANMDQVLRLLSGVKALKNEAAPLRLFDKSNVKQAGTPPVATKGFGSAYRKGYLKLWGIK